MGRRPPARPPLLRPGWVSLRPVCRSGLPGLLRLIRCSRPSSRTNTNTGCAWRACRLFPAQPEENRGKLLS